jgi:hypothetical protein
LLEKGLRLAVLILGVIGVRKLIRSEQRSLGVMLACGLIGLFLLSYFGAFIPALAAWQPLRFKIPCDLFLIVGAAYAIGRQLKSRDVTKPWIISLLLGGAALTVALNLVQSESSGRLQLRSRLNSDSQRIIAWITREAPAEGRVLFEESGDETGFVHDGVYLSNFVALASGRQLIGGPTATILPSFIPADCSSATSAPCRTQSCDIILACTTSVPSPPFIPLRSNV